MDDEELYFDHPILFRRNIFEQAWGYAWKRITDSHPKDRKYQKQKANQKARRAIRQALKGNNPRIRRLPGDSWEVW
jgi:hypothetical protein